MKTTLVRCDQCSADISRNDVRLTVEVYRRDKGVSFGGTMQASNGSSFFGGDFCDMACLVERCKATKFPLYSAETKTARTKHS